MNTHIIEIEDYVSHSPEAKAIMTDFSTSKFIHKQSCGIGGTTAILDITHQTVIICSPLTGMIKSKEANEKHNHIFIYGLRKQKTTDSGSNKKWKTVEDNLYHNQQFILNTTPNQLLKLKTTKSYLFSKLLHIPVFVDESHMAAENDWRPELADFMHVLFTEWQANFILSTATPCYKYLDLPAHISERMQFYTFKKKAEPIKPIAIYPFEQYQTQIIEEVAKGNRVVIFTNDKRVMTKIVELEGISTQFLVGDTLETKIKTIKEFSEDEELMMRNGSIREDVDVTILSTKYLTGYDITFKSASVFIISNYNPVNKVDNRTISDIVQAYGRIRNTVNRAAASYNNTAYKILHNVEYFMKGFEQALLKPKPEYLVDTTVNHTRVLNHYLPLMDEYKTFSSTASLAACLGEMGFTVEIVPAEPSTLISTALSVPQRLKCLLSLELEHLVYHTDKVFSSIQGDLKEYNGYTRGYLTLFASSCIIKFMENEHLTT